MFQGGELTVDTLTKANDYKTSIEFDPGTCSSTARLWKRPGSSLTKLMAVFPAAVGKSGGKSGISAKEQLVSPQIPKNGGYFNYE